MNLPRLDEVEMTPQEYRAFQESLSQLPLGRIDPWNAYLQGWLANNAAKVPHDNGWIYPDTDHRILDLLNEIFETVRVHGSGNRLFHTLEQRLTPLLRIAYAEIDKQDGKPDYWAMIPRLTHPIRRHLRGMKF